MERIIGLIASIMNSIPFWIIAVYDKDSRELIGFWSGDKTLIDFDCTIGIYMVYRCYKKTLEPYS